MCHVLRNAASPWLEYTVHSIVLYSVLYILRKRSVQYYGLRYVCTTVLQYYSRKEPRPREYSTVQYSECIDAVHIGKATKSGFLAFGYWLSVRLKLLYCTVLYCISHSQSVGTSRSGIGSATDSERNSQWSEHSVCTVVITNKTTKNGGKARYQR